MDMIIHFFKLLTISLIASQITAGAKVAGPTLNFPAEFVLYSSQSSPLPLEITCSGLKKLHWETKVSGDVINIRSNYAPVGYSSTLTLQEPYPEDTGNFTCRYDTGEYATTYVYVFDNQTAFVNPTPHGSLKVNIGDNIVLDCRTTHPNITVRVMKINSVDVTDKFEYDTRWYIFKKRAESIKENGLYACKAKGFQNDNTWLVDIQRTIKPTIYYYYNSHFVVGSSFQLNCSIPVSENGHESPTFKWKTPSGLNHEIMEYKKGISVVSSLKVSYAQMGDDGDYICLVKIGSDETSAFININITESIEPFVRFDKREQAYLSVMERELFQWDLYFRAFPNNVSYSFYDHVNRTLTDDLPKVSTYFSYDEGKVSLRINNISAEDFGHYRAQLSVDGTVDIATVIVIVNATPKIEFTNFPDYFDSNKPISLQADVLSFDGRQKELNVTWWFNDKCPAGFGSCEDPTKGLQLANGIITKKNMYNKFEAKLNFNASSSGVIESWVENKFGENSTKAHVILSDIGGKFVFKVAVQSVDEIINKSQSKSIAEGDHVILTCAALDFFYEGLSFTTKVDSGSLIADCRTNLSSGFCLDMSASMSMQGSYECRARNRKSGKTEVATLSLNVIAEQSPSILEISSVTLEGTTVTVKLLKPFHIFCYTVGTPSPNITWLKDGEEIAEIPELANDINQTIFLKDNKQLLEFKVAKKIYSGKYVCRVKNRAGIIEPFIDVQVETHETLDEDDGDEEEAIEELEPTEEPLSPPELGEDESPQEGETTPGSVSKRRRSKKGKKYYKRRYKKMKKSKKEKMKCPMMTKKEDMLESQFGAVWKQLQTLQEEIIRLQHQTKAEESRLPLECSPMGRNDTHCRIDEHSETCSGNGFCSCGFCVCNPHYQGKFCECEPCEKQDGVVCGGRDKGTCDCGKCSCKLGFQGTNCECSTDDDTTECEDRNGLVCSGNGDCVCNSCQCHDSFHGNLCEFTNSTSNACEELERCILCQIFDVSAPLCSRCDLEISMVDLLEPSEEQQYCSVSSKERSCVLKFAYIEPQDNGATTQVELEKFSCHSLSQRNKKD